MAKQMLPHVPDVPTGWRAIYRVRKFCDVDRAEPQHEIGWNDWDTLEEAMTDIRETRHCAISTRLELVMLAPTVPPYSSVIQRNRRSIEQHKKQMRHKPPIYSTPDLASSLYDFSLRHLVPRPIDTRQEVANG